MEIDYAEELNRLTAFFRLIWAIPIFIILAIISANADSTYIVVSETGETISRITTTGGGISGAPLERGTNGSGVAFGHGASTVPQ